MCWYISAIFVCLNERTDDCLSPLVLACLGFLSPANRGALMTCAVVLWVLLGTPAGYVSARLYKSETALFQIASLSTCRFSSSVIVPVLIIYLFFLKPKLVNSFWR